MSSSTNYINNNHDQTRRSTQDDNHNIADDQQRRGSDDLEKKIEKLKEINKMQEKRINNLDAKLLQDLNRYFLFQGVILAAILPRSFNCHLYWVPLTMSLLAAILNIFNQFFNTRKLLKFSEALDDNTAKLEAYKDEALGRGSANSVDPIRRRWRSMGYYFNIVICGGSAVVVCYCCIHVGNDCKKN